MIQHKHDAQEKTMPADLTGSHPSIDVEDKMKSYRLMLNLMRFTIVAVALILGGMAYFLV